MSTPYFHACLHVTFMHAQTELRKRIIKHKNIIDSMVRNLLINFEVASSRIGAIEKPPKFNIITEFD